MDLYGWRDLEERNRELVLGMAAYEHSVSSEFSIGPILRFPGQNARFEELEERAPVILRQSMRMGIYRPPLF
jgi:hypothetical protein